MFARYDKVVAKRYGERVTGTVIEVRMRVNSKVPALVAYVVDWGNGDIRVIGAEHAHLLRPEGWQSKTGD